MTALGCTKPGSMLPRMRALGLAEPCTRCGGSGSYSYCQMYGTRCFGCNGGGTMLPKITPALLRKVAVAVAAGDLEPYFAEQKRIGECKRLATAHLEPGRLRGKVEAAYDAALASFDPRGVAWYGHFEKVAAADPALRDAYEEVSAVRQKLWKIRERLNLADGREYRAADKKWAPIAWEPLLAEAAAVVAEYEAADARLAAALGL
jgi:hypothetical protein